MKSLVILQQGEIAPPGTIAHALDEGGYDWQVRRLWAGDPLPRSPEEIAGLIALGGPMSTRQEDEYPFLAFERAFLRQALSANVPLLGICLGGQLLAEAAGGRVYKRSAGEFGWVSIRFAADDPLLSELASPLLVFEWHSYSFTLPPGAMPLAAGVDDLQAFRLGQAWGLQFHPEVELNTVLSWVSDAGDALEPHQQGLVATLRHQTEDLMPAYQQMCRQLVGNWLTAVGLDKRCS